MRISTVTMFEQSMTSLNRQQSDLLRVSQQIASGRRVVNPSDDPMAASRAIGVDQALATTEQYSASRVSARNSLSQTESIIHSVADAITSAKGLLIQASSDTLSDANRASIASELKGVYETLVGQANATDGNGRYLFGGFQDNAPPFIRTAEGNVVYNGDTSPREQRVDSSRLMPVTETGAAIFQSVTSGAGYIAEAQANNQGNVTFVGPRTTNVNADGYGDSYRVVFTENAAAESGFDYQVQRFENGDWLEDDADLVASGEYTGEGQQLAFGGISITLQGDPVEADEILVTRAGSEQRPANLFSSLEAAIRVLETPAGTNAEKAALRNTLNTSMRDMDNALDNVLTVRASAGARLNELNVLDAVGSNRTLNYTQTLSDLVDLDYAEAISEYSLRQLGLQAAQKTFVDMQGMSLLNYM